MRQVHHERIPASILGLSQEGELTWLWLFWQKMNVIYLPVSFLADVGFTLLLL